MVNIEFDMGAGKTQPKLGSSRHPIGYRAPDPSEDSDVESSDEEDRAAVRQAVRTLREAGFDRSASSAKVPTQTQHSDFVEVDAEASTHSNQPVIIDLDSDTDKHEAVRSEIIDLTGTQECQDPVRPGCSQVDQEHDGNGMHNSQACFGDNNHGIPSSPRSEDRRSGNVVDEKNDDDFNMHNGAEPKTIRVSTRDSSPGKEDDDAADEHIGASVSRDGELRSTPMQNDAEEAVAVSTNEPDEDGDDASCSGGIPSIAAEISDQETSVAYDDSDDDAEPPNLRRSGDGRYFPVMRHPDWSAEHSRYGLFDWPFIAPPMEAPHWPTHDFMYGHSFPELQPTPVTTLPPLIHMTSGLPRGPDGFLGPPPRPRPLGNRLNADLPTASQSIPSSGPDATIDAVGDAIDQAKLPPWRNPVRVLSRRSA